MAPRMAKAQPFTTTRRKKASITSWMTGARYLSYTPAGRCSTRMRTPRCLPWRSATALPSMASQHMLKRAISSLVSKVKRWVKRQNTCPSVAVTMIMQRAIPSHRLIFMRTSVSLLIWKDINVMTFFIKVNLKRKGARTLLLEPSRSGRNGPPRQRRGPRLQKGRREGS